jgi:hypothetical protein
MAKGTKTLNSAIKVDDRRQVFLNVKGSPPEDADVDNGEVVLWIDGGTNKIMIKTRLGASVLNGEVSALT